MMDEDEEIAKLKEQEAKRVRDQAKKCLRHASFQLGKAAYEIDEYLKDFSTARIPIRRQVILNEAIGHLVSLRWQGCRCSLHCVTILKVQLNHHDMPKWHSHSEVFYDRYS